MNKEAISANRRPCFSTRMREARLMGAESLSMTFSVVGGGEHRAPLTVHSIRSVASCNRNRRRIFDDGGSPSSGPSGQALEATHADSRAGLPIPPERPGRLQTAPSQPGEGGKGPWVGAPSRAHLALGTSRQGSGASHEPVVLATAGGDLALEGDQLIGILRPLVASGQPLPDDAGLGLQFLQLQGHIRRFDASAVSLLASSNPLQDFGILGHTPPQNPKIETGAPWRPSTMSRATKEPLRTRAVHSTPSSS